MDYMSWVDRNWGLLNDLTRVHVALYRASGGRLGHHPPGAPPMLLLDHVGAKSGTHRTSPLVYGHDGKDLILIASKGGNPKNPAWYYNLMANPNTTVQVGSQHLNVHARRATSEERPRLWSLMVGVYRGYEGYQRRTAREIPVVVLEPH
jgi:F420H(2)-dependent quinone reductase